MYTKAVLSLVAILSILITLALGIQSQTSSTTVSLVSESDHVPEHDDLRSAIKHLFEKHHAELLLYALENPEQFAERQDHFNELLDSMEQSQSLLLETLPNSGSYLDAYRLMRVTQKDHKIHKQAKEMEVIFNCPKGDVLSLIVCDFLVQVQAEFGPRRSSFLPILRRSLCPSAPTEAAKE